MTAMFRRIVLLALVAVLVAGACGDDEKSKSSESSGKPKVEVPEGPPPTELQVEDLKVGTGAEATAGTQVEVHYVGVAYSTKKQFDSSWDRGQPLPFPLGAKRVIKGWEQGVPGMKVGGRRRLIIPPDLAYGPGGFPPAIGPNETLVFVVDLVSVG
jgi:peptidylprolyl isomerase